MKKYKIKNKIAEELGVQISRLTPLKSEWRNMLEEIRKLKKKNRSRTEKKIGDIGANIPVFEEKIEEEEVNNGN